MKKITKSILLTSLALLLLVGGAFASQAAYKAHMRADDIVPLPVTVDSQAKGEAEFELSDDGLRFDYEIEVKKIDHITMAHIHQYVGDGRNGPIMVWLYPDPTSTGPGAPTGQVQGDLVSGSFGPEHLRNGFTWEQLLALINNGEAYVNVHTSEAPAGEINGHIH
jgi:hypothetical protein